MDPLIGRNMFRDYYEYLENNQPHLLVALYRPGSTVDRLDVHGVLLEEAYTMPEIEALIMTWNFSEVAFWFRFWQCWDQGILVVALGSLRSAGFIRRRKFVQAVIIARYTDNTYFICNDVLCFLGDEDDESTTSSSSDGNTDNDSDPNSLSNAAESDITSQQGRMESADLLESDSQNNADPSDESSVYIEIDSLTSFPNSLANDIRGQPALNETEQSLRHKKLTLDEVQDHKQSDPDVNEVLPGTEDTDLESLIALAHEMRI